MSGGQGAKRGRAGSGQLAKEGETEHEEISSLQQQMQPESLQAADPSGHVEQELEDNSDLCIITCVAAQCLGCTRCQTAAWMVTTAWNKDLTELRDMQLMDLMDLRARIVKSNTKAAQ
eukprot:282045-Rhodomonas_salina.1